MQQRGIQYKGNPETYTIPLRTQRSRAGRTLPEADKFQLDVRVFGEKGVLVIDVNREQLELRSRDGRHQQFEIPDGEGAYSCEGPPDRFIELIQGTGSNDSPGEVAARSVEMIDAMFRSADQAGAPVAV